LSAVDSQIRSKHDGPTIGLLLCKSKSRIIAEYALRDTKKPMGVAEYRLVHALPSQLKASLPSIEQLESEFKESTRLPAERAETPLKRHSKASTTASLSAKATRGKPHVPTTKAR
jgi:hypothetical protein